MGESKKHGEPPRKPGDLRRLPNISVERSANITSAEATWLLIKIIKDLDTQSFTPAEVKASLGAYAKHAPLDPEEKNRHFNIRGGAKLKRSHIEMLLSRGFIEENSDGSFRVTDLGQRHAEEEDDLIQGVLGEEPDENT